MLLESRLNKDEQGVAMVVAVMVSFVILLLSLVVISQSIHNTNESAYDRNRLLSISAAEAGINNFFSFLQSPPANWTSASGATWVPCSGAAMTMTGTVGSSPLSTYQVTPTYFADSAGTQASTCPAGGYFTNSVYPRAVELSSMGQVNGGVSRYLQTFLRLAPNLAGAQAAIVVDGTGGLNLVNSLTLLGSGSSNDADIYVNNGPLSLSNSATLYGNVYVGGGCATPSVCTVTMGNGATIRKDLWAAGGITLNNPATISGNAISSTGSMTNGGSSGGTIEQNATTAGTISPSIVVNGVSSPNTSSPLPPTQPLPQITWNSTDWTNPPDGSAPYTIQQYTTGTSSDCTNAKSYLLNPANLTGNKVVYISAVCNISFGSTDAVNFQGNLAIVTNGSVTMGGNMTWTKTTSGVGNLYFIDLYRSGLNCSTGSYNITDGNNITYANVNVFMYSPCTVNISNRNTFSGQVMSTTVNVTNNETITFQPIVVPGQGRITGFKQDIVYLREQAQ